MPKTFVLLGSIFMFIGVGAGAFGAHGLSAYFEGNPDLVSPYDTAVRYQLIHGLALLIIAWVLKEWPGILPVAAGYSFIAGILLFSGSLYLLSLTGVSRFGIITPFGGAAFLLGWIFMCLAAWRS